MESFMASNQSRFEESRRKGIVASLAAMRTDESVDVTLICGDKEFGAHKVILEASTPYFKRKFRNGSEEEQNGKVVLETVEPDILDAILSYIYTGDVSAINSEQCVKDVLAAAHMMELHEVTQFCFEALSDLTSNENWSEILGISIRYKHKELKTKVLDFIFSNFETLRTTDTFLEIRFEKLKAILKFAGVRKMCFDKFLVGVLTWLRHDLAQRKKFTSELFAYIEPALLRHTYLKSLLRRKKFMKLSPKIANEMNELAVDVFKLNGRKQWETLTFTVSKLSKLKDDLRSSEAMIQKLPWSIVIKPLGNGIIGFYIACNHNSEKRWSCRADVKFSLLSKRTAEKMLNDINVGRNTNASKGISLPSCNRSQECVFCSDEHEFGFPEYLKLYDNSNSNNQYVKNDTATFQVNIIADIPTGL